MLNSSGGKTAFIRYEAACSKIGARGGCGAYFPPSVPSGRRKGEAMEEWTRLNKSKCFITDLGAEQTREVDDKTVVVGRYAVWSPIANAENHRIVEVGSDCEMLKQKYNIKDSMIYRLKKGEE